MECQIALGSRGVPPLVHTRGAAAGCANRANQGIRSRGPRPFFYCPPPWYERCPWPAIVRDAITGFVGARRCRSCHACRPMGHFVFVCCVCVAEANQGHQGFPPCRSPQGRQVYVRGSRGGCVFGCDRCRSFVSWSQVAFGVGWRKGRQSGTCGKDDGIRDGVS